MQDNNKHFIQVHRLGNKVALYAGGRTIYLTVADALAISGALTAACRDVVQYPRFQDSQVGTFHLHDVEVKP